MAAPHLAESAEAPFGGADRRRPALLAALAAGGLAAIVVFRTSLPGNDLSAVTLGPYALAGVAYLLAARASLSLRAPEWRRMCFAFANLGGIALFLDWSQGRRRGIFLMTAYVAMVSWHYLLLRNSMKPGRSWTWAAFASPLAALAIVRYLPALFEPLWRVLPGILDRPLDIFFIGISYVAFRLSYLALEVRNGAAPVPDYWQYLGFCFFLPTLVAGPINPYSVHQGSIEKPDSQATPLGLTLARIAAGFAKYQFLGNMFNQLSYRGLLLDGHPHGAADLVVAAISYHLYLYCNFSGFCDIAIGAAGLLGIQVKENFRNPMASRNVQDYWTRWHITLSNYMRDVVFTPLSKALAGRVGLEGRNHAIAAAITAVFLLVGIWHGAGANYILYGAVHAAGVISVHYYTAWLKRRLGKAGYRAYEENRAIRALATAMTFVFVSASLFFFANDVETMRRIIDAVEF
jgi:D-alanyl-lipoteichoic acid acyltransferase DltB (MBOAT superfamily)